MPRYYSTRRAVAIRNEMRALEINTARPSLPVVIVGLIACVNTASAVASLAFL